MDIYFGPRPSMRRPLSPTAVRIIMTIGLVIMLVIIIGIIYSSATKKEQPDDRETFYISSRHERLTRPHHHK